MNITRLVAPVALAAAALIASPASAAVVVNANGSVTVSGTSGGTANLNIGGNSNGANVPGLTSTLSLTFVQATSGTYTFDYTLTNTSIAPTTSSRVTAFGFNTNPNITLNGASIISGSVFDEIRYNANMPNGMADVEVCFTTNNCSGGGGDGLTIGQSTSGRFTLNFGTTNLASLTLDNILLRYQSINAPGIQGGSGTGGVVTAVPEPSTWALMLIGFGAIGASMRRRRVSAIAQIA